MKKQKIVDIRKGLEKAYRLRDFVSNTIAMKYVKCFPLMKFLLPALIAAIWLLPSGARADYVLGSGDTLEISVFGRSDLTRRTTVDIDGKVVIPPAGEIKVAGMTMTELRTKLQELLSTSDTLRVSDIIVSLVEPRPFYIYGDVAKAGAYPYRSDVTVRHAIALAGGLGLVPTTNISPVTLAELRGRYKSLKNEFEKQQIRVAGLRAEMKSKNDLELSGSARTQLPPAGTAEELIRKGQKEIAELVDLELQRLKIRSTERDVEQKYRSTAVKLAESQIDALEQGQKVDEQASKEQADELARVADLTRRGLASSGRVTDEQRAAVLLRSREMDTKARLAVARQAREEAQRRLDGPDDRAIKLPEELQDALVQLEGTRAQLSSIAEQLILSGEILENLDANEEKKGPEITIYRKEGGASVRISASEDTEIEPGDVVEIKTNTSRVRAANVN